MPSLTSSHRCCCLLRSVRVTLEGLDLALVLPPAATGARPWSSHLGDRLVSLCGAEGKISFFSSLSLSRVFTGCKLCARLCLFFVFSLFFNIKVHSSTGNESRQRRAFPGHKMASMRLAGTPISVSFFCSGNNASPSSCATPVLLPVLPKTSVSYLHGDF